MKDFLAQIESAANEAGLYYLALAGALVIPDICGALEASNGEATRPRYISWFDTYVAPRYTSGGQPPILTGEDCWHFRCSFLHQGRTNHPDIRYSRIMFVEPGVTPFTYQGVTNQALAIDVRRFCSDMTGAVGRWMEMVSGTQPYEANLATLIRRYPSGFPPYFYRLPVIT